MKKIIFHFLMSFVLLIFSGCTSGGAGEENPEKISACFELDTSSEIGVDTEITFKNCSENGLNFVWNFGDGNSSTEKEPVHSYSNTGEYEVSLIVSDENYSDTIAKSIIIEITKDFVTYSDSLYVLDHVYFYKNPEDHKDILIIVSANLIGDELGQVDGTGEILIFQFEEKGILGDHVLEIDNNMNGLGVSMGSEDEFDVKFKNGNVNITETDSIFVINFDGLLSDSTEIVGNCTSKVKIFDRSNW